MQLPIKFTLQVEFKYRQQCTRFAKLIQKGTKHFDSKAERCVWLKFDSEDSREKVKKVLMENVKCELKYRESGVDYLFVS
jgi:hypothetical protein